MEITYPIIRMTRKLPALLALLAIAPCLPARADGPNAADAAPLTRQQAETAVTKLSAECLTSLKQERSAEITAKSITLGDKTMRWLERSYGNAPDGKRSLWISMHGGGNASAEVNDGQWQNQILLYQPAEGIYLAPRAPTNTWNLWHEDHIDLFFARLIEDMVATRGVDPNKVYLMGYSAGGDGVWQLAPRLADRLAAASMMAGHPNDASLLGLRNLPFAIFVGAEDSGYHRNDVAKQKAEELDRLQQADSGGYTHISRIYPGLGHWMNRKDAESVPWMAAFTRNPWPKKIVWLQDHVSHTRFYWLAIPRDAVKKGCQITAQVSGQTISLDGDVPNGITLWLSDQLLDLDQPVTVTVKGRQVHQGKITRSADVIRASLAERPDATACATARLILP
jgi:poly(3-hydroxybutyrate) depolymerase